MNTHWTIVALLSSALFVGCGDRDLKNAQTFGEDQQIPAAAPVTPEQVSPSAPAPAPQAASPDADDSAERRARATTGRRPAAERAVPSPADAPPAAPRAEWRALTVPAGTALPLELITAVSSATATVETPVQARVRQAVVVNGYTVIPARTILTGEVIHVERAGRVQGRSRLAFRFNAIRLASGSEDFRTNPLTYVGEATKGEDATKIGAGAGIGGIIGGIVGGGKGAAKGAAIGGAAGTGVVLATRGNEVTLASGTDLAATLASPFTIRVQVR